MPGSSITRFDFPPGKAFVSYDQEPFEPSEFHRMASFFSTDYADFFSRAVPHKERSDITKKHWTIVERHCYLAYESVRSLILDKDYVASARFLQKTLRQRANLNPTLQHVINYVSQEIYDPGWIKTLEDVSLSA